VLQGLPEGRVALLQLMEQPHVLDGDDRLVGERLDELDLPFAKGEWLHPAKQDVADVLALLFEGSYQVGAGGRGAITPRGKIVLVPRVWDVERPVLANPARDRVVRGNRRRR